MTDIGQLFDEPYVYKRWFNSSYCFGNYVRCNPHNVLEQSDEEAFGATETIWIITSAILIFQMQTGFGLLEAGSVTAKSETNIMVKNALDLIFGGITYWMFGFAFSFGDSEYSNPFIGYGQFFLIVTPERLGYIYALFLFQLSFACTSMTIVSGAMVERTKLYSYNIFSLFMTWIYSVPAHWMWASNGFLLTLGAQDVSGCGPVHLVGGVTGLVATLILGPRRGAFDSPRAACVSPVKVILGMLFLWWGWLRFNSGSVYIVTKGEQWVLAVLAGVNTILASIGGGITGVICSVLMSKFYKQEKRAPYDVSTIVCGILGGLVSITSICTLCEPWFAVLIGSIGAALTVPTEIVVRKLRVDDPVGVVPVHVVCAAWGLFSVGLFMPENKSTIPGQGGLFRTGQFYILGVQTLTILVITVWTLIFATFFLKLVDLIFGLRLNEEHEIIGADIVEHGAGGMFTYTHTAADSALSLMSFGDQALDTEFKVKINQMMRVMFQSIAANDLFLSMKPIDDGSIGFHICKAKPKNEMCVAGPSMDDNGSTAKNGKLGRDNMAFSSNASLDSFPGPLTISAAGGATPDVKSRSKNKHSKRNASEITLSIAGTEITLTDETGKSKKKIISSDMPSTPGFIPPQNSSL